VGVLTQTVYTTVNTLIQIGGGDTPGSPLVGILISSNSLNVSSVVNSSVAVTLFSNPPLLSTAPAGFSFVQNDFVYSAVQVSLPTGQVTTLLLDAEVTISYSETTSPSGLEIFTLADNSIIWVPLPSVVDTVNHLVTAYTPHFSTFAILTPGGMPAPDLNSVRVYPIPYRPNSGNPNLGGGDTGIVFDQLPASASIKIYTVSGQLVTSKDASSPTGGVSWDARNDRGRDVASGLYIAVISSPGNKSVVKKLLIIR
jgi:hypothetical protein